MIKEQIKRWLCMILYEELNEEQSFDLAMSILLNHNKSLFVSLSQPIITEEAIKDVQIIKEVVPRLAKRLFSIKQQCWMDYMVECGKNGKK